VSNMAKTLLGCTVVSHAINKDTKHHWLTVQVDGSPQADVFCRFEEHGWELAFPPVIRTAGSYQIGASLTFKSLNKMPYVEFEERLGR